MSSNRSRDPAVPPRRTSSVPPPLAVAKRTTLSSPPPATRTAPPLPERRTRVPTVGIDWETVAASFIERCGFMAAILDRAGTLVLLSRPLIDAFGWTLEEAAHRSWVEVFVPPETASEAASALRQALRGVVTRCRLQLRSRCGDRFHAQLELGVVGRGRRQAVLVVVTELEAVRKQDLSQQDLDYRIATGSIDFGRIETMGGTIFGQAGASAPLHCYEVLHKRTAPCEDCPVLRTGAPWPRTVVRRLTQGPNGTFEVVTASPLTQATALITRRTVSDHVLSAIHEARIEALATKGRLTERERELLRELMLGRTTDEIAESLSLSRRTVKFHQSNLLQKVGADSRIDLLRLLGF